MSSPFQQAALEASTAVDAVYGEQVRLDPMVPGRYMGPVHDPDRLPIEVTAAIAVRARMTRMSDDKFGRDFNTTFAGAHMFATVETADLAGFIPRQGDRLIRLDHGNETFEIVSIAPCGMVRTRFDLAQVKEQG
jgi:hypothetical protein